MLYTYSTFHNTYHFKVGLQKMHVSRLQFKSILSSARGDWDSLGKTLFWQQNNVHMTVVHNTSHVFSAVSIKGYLHGKNWVTIIQELHKHKIKTRQTIIKQLKCFILHDKNSKIFSDKILLNKSLVLCSVKHYPSTLLKGKLKNFQSIL